MKLGGRLFWQVYLHGVLLLVAVGVAVAIVGIVSGRTAPWREYAERLSSTLSARADEMDRAPERLERDLETYRDLVGVELSLYRVDGTLVASSAEPPVPPLAPEEVESIDGPLRLPRRPWAAAAPVYAQGRLVGYATARLPERPHPTRALAALAAVLLALAVGSIPLLRAITRPLERLTETARRLGEGDLGARARIRKRGEVGELASAFDEMAGRIEAQVRGEKELLANLSHELRTPLARIRVALELAAEGDAQKAAASLGEIGVDLAELERLVEDILTTARLDLARGRAGEGATPLRLERVEVAEVVGRAAERFRAAHPARSLEVALGQGLPPLGADPALLRRAVDNLLDNARKYSDESKPVALEARLEQGAVILEVRDQGIGVEPGDLERLFTPFFRTDRSRARGTGGVGLGLALTRRIVEAHGGSIGVESVPGQGTTVRMRLPPAAE